MAYSEQYCDSYFLSFTDPVYVWGANISNIKEQIDSHAYMMNLWKSYGSSSGQYNQAYYEAKYQDAMSKSGYVSDCSGFMYVINDKHDLTAQGYYNNCNSKGDISSIDVSHSCLLFRGTSSKISHVGYYCSSTGESIEMANSQDNFRKQNFNPKNWTYWGKPEFIDYSLSSSTAPVIGKQYLYKGIDISTYQKNVDYKKVKESGVEFAVLKIINKSLQPDSMFEQHVIGCVTYGISVSCYNYSYAVTVEQAREAANAVLKVLNGRKLTVYLDVEDNVQKGLGSYLIDIINAYQEVIERAGLTFGLYSGLSFYRSYIAPYQSSLKCKNRWIARYNKGYTEMSFDEDPDEAYKPMDEIMAWQYTSSGIVNGINGRVDLDVMYSLPVALNSNDITPIPTPIPIPEPVNLNSVIKNTVKTNGSRLNVRSKPSTDGSIVGKMNNGANVIIYGVDKTGEWARLSVPDNYWSSMKYISSTGVGIVTAENSLYVRSSDSKSGEVWGVYKSNTKIKILHQSTNTGWYLTVGIGKDGKQIGGWCSNKYIRTT